MNNTLSNTFVQYYDQLFEQYCAPVNSKILKKQTNNVLIALIAHMIG